MNRADLFRERQAAIEAARLALREWTATLGRNPDDPKRKAAFWAYRAADQREKNARADYANAIALESVNV